MESSVDTRPPCRFFQVGRCTQGSACRFSHELVREGVLQRFSTPCKFFAEGRCANTACPFAHVVAQPRSLPPQAARAVPGRPLLVPRPTGGAARAPQGYSNAPPRADAHALSPSEAALSEAATCAVCLERVLGVGRLFGLLTQCEHCVCLPCIREWRTSEVVDASAARGCPVCRVLSPFVIPSKVFVQSAARKQQIRQHYLASLASRPCKHFDLGRGSCPFGSSCFYLHATPDGRPVQPPTPRVAYGGAHRAGAGGGVDVTAARLDSLTLSDFFSGAAGATAAYVDPLSEYDDGRVFPADGYGDDDGAAAFLDSIPTTDRRAAAAAPPTAARGAARAGNATVLARGAVNATGGGEPDGATPHKPPEPLRYADAD
jgi:hypothetical protein